MLCYRGRELFPPMLSNLETALDAREKGITCIPCYPGSKIPAVKWKEYQTGLPPVEQIERWFRDTLRNVAMICTGSVIFDAENESVVQRVIAECGPTPHMVRTPRGGRHLGYRRRKGVELGNRVKIKGMELDVRTDGGLAMLPPSRTRGGEYAWLTDGLSPIASLPVARISWSRDQKKKQIHSVITPLDDDAVMVRRAMAWIACVEGAVSGNRGHDRTFRVVCKLLHPAPRGFGLTLAQAWPLLLMWNRTCEPEWTVRELEHKCSDAKKVLNA